MKKSVKKGLIISAIVAVIVGIIYLAIPKNDHPVDPDSIIEASEETGMVGEKIVDTAPNGIKKSTTYLKNTMAKSLSSSEATILVSKTAPCQHVPLRPPKFKATSKSTKTYFLPIRPNGITKKAPN